MIIFFCFAQRYPLFTLFRILRYKRGRQNINVLFAHNDDMALGAIQAIEEYSLKPGGTIHGPGHGLYRESIVYCHQE